MSGTGRTPRRGHRLREAISRGTARLQSHRIALGLVVAAVGGFLAYVAWISINGPPFQNRYELHVLVPSDAPILKKGDAVRIAGRLAGFITDIQPDPEEHAVEVTTELQPSFAPVGLDARANVKVRSIVYLTYLEIFPGDRSNPMPEGGTIPVDRTTSGVDLLEVVQLFDQQTREELQSSTVNLGSGLAGRGEELNAALADFDQTAVDLNAQLAAVTRRPGAIAGLLSGGARTFRGLRGSGPGQVAGVIGSGSAALGAIASRRTQLGQSIELLRPFEDEFLTSAPIANPLLANATALSRRLEPVATGLNAALPDVNDLLSRGDTLRTETSALTALIDPVFRAEGPQIADLYPTVYSLPKLLAAVNQTANTIAPYTHDINLAGRGVVGSTSVLYPEGQTAPGTSALRFAPVFTCAGGRDPFPAPGATLGHSQSC